MLTKDTNLPDELETDPWVAAFVIELHKFFGTPGDVSACLGKRDRLLFAWARMGISHAMKKDEIVWRALKGRTEPEVAAEVFCRRFYDQYNRMVVQDMPDFPNAMKGLTGMAPGGKNQNGSEPKV